MKPVPLTNPITTFLPKFQGGGPDPPPLDPRMQQMFDSSKLKGYADDNSKFDENGRKVS